MIPTFTSKLNALTDIGDMGTPWPAKQSEGKMLTCAFYESNSATTHIHAIIPFAVEDVLPSMALSEGDTWEHIWVNPNPEWHSASDHPGGWLNRQPGNGWYTNRANALRASYLGNLQPRNCDNAMITQGGNPTTGNRLQPMTQSFANGYMNNPPIHYLKVQPLQGPEGILTIVANVWIDYHMKIEIINKGNHPQLGFHVGNNFTPDNNEAIRNMSTYDARQCTGGAAAATGILPNIEVDDQFLQPSAAKKRKVDQTVPDDMSNNIGNDLW